MAIDDHINDEKLKYGIKEKLQKYQLYDQAKIEKYEYLLQVKRYYLLLKN